MKLNRKDLKKIIYDFNSISNRLMQADFEDYNGILKKFISFIQNTPIIFEYIVDCGDCEQNLDEEFEEIRKSYGRCIFSLGDNDEEEVRNVFAILKYIVENKIQIHYAIALGYSSSNKYQDKVKGFNDRVLMVLIRHIESYLTKIGIDMGVDERAIYSITVQKGQVIIASDNATVNANSTNYIDYSKCADLILAVREASTELKQDDIDTLESSLSIIEDEIGKENPRKGFLNTAIAGIKTIKGSAEFAAAVTALVQYFSIVGW